MANERTKATAKKAASKKKKAEKKGNTVKRPTVSKGRRAVSKVKKKSRTAAGAAKGRVTGKNAVKDSTEYSVVEQPPIKPVSVHEIIVQVLDAASRQPVRGIKARVVDLTDKRKPRSLGHYVTTARGIFVLPLPIEEASRGIKSPEKTATRQIRVTIFDHDDQEIHQADISLAPDGPKRIAIAVKAPKAPSLPSQTLLELNKQLKLKISKKTLTELKQHDIVKLADLRNADELLQKKIDAILLDKDTRLKLAAHANLELLTSNTEHRAALVERGYNNPFSIANTPRHAFLSSFKNDLDTTDALQLYLKAEAQTAILKNLLTGLRVNAANSAAQPSRTRSDMQGGEEIGECPLSESALSPTAYFSDLVDYTLKHLEPTDPPLTLDILGEMFHQPFSELPISSKWVNREVRQVRIAVEVLRSYVQEQNPINQPALEAAENKCRYVAYETLLRNIGASYQEMQLIRSADEEQRKAIAERLGIDPTHLNELAAGANSPQDLTESYLDRVFGLPDTTRDPLSTGAKSGDSNGRVVRWVIEGISWNRNTDKSGAIWGTFAPTNTVMLQVKLYRDQERTQLVASGESQRQTRLKVIVHEENGSGLSGRIDIVQPTQAGESGDFSLAVVPRFLAWKFDHLHELWLRQDWPEELYDLDRLPIIEPDLITKDDLRKPEDGQPVFGLWQERRNQIDSLLNDLDKILEQKGLGKTLTEVLGVQPSVLDTLLENLRNGTDIDDTRHQIESLELTVESFTRLMEVKAKDAAGEEVSDEEWQEAIAILAQAEKQKSKYAEWKAEEQDLKMILGPKNFWISRDEPVLSKWLASQDARQAWRQTLEARSKSPIIDPDLVSETELVNRPEDSKYGSTAIKLWQPRQKWIGKHRSELEQSYTANLAGMIKDVIGLKPDEWQELAQRPEAGESIDDRLKQLSLSFDAYEYLLHIDRMLNNGITVPPDDWTSVYDIVFQVQKQRKFSEWRIAEKKENITLSPDFFIPERKTAEDLPPWRASLEQRRDWEGQCFSRMIQDQSLIDAQLEAVGAAEEAALPILRDGLITATSMKWGSLGTEVGQFNNCFDLAIAADGSVYVTDRYNHRVQKFDNLGRIVNTWGKLGSGEGQFKKPTGVAVDKDGCVYVTDDNNRVQKFDANGKVMTWGSPDSGKPQFNSPPRGVTADANGFVYVADTYKHRIQKFDNTGHLEETWGGVQGNGNGQFNFPGRMAVDGAGNVYVADMHNHRIQKLDTNGKFLGKWGSQGSGNGQFLYPGGVAVDANGYIYVTDYGNHRIQRFDSNGNYVSKWGSQGSADCQFCYPTGVGVDADGNVFVADTLNHRVQKVCPDHLDEKANWISQNLLIDPKAAPCQTTTRLGHAISTFQALVRAARQRKIEIGSLTFQDDEHFEEEWTWIGSYGNWRAAMLVFLYPDIVLLPTLSKDENKTWGFKEIMRTLGSISLSNSAIMNDLSQEYVSYLSSISQLERFQACYGYIFGRSTNTKNVYWRLERSIDEQASEYEFWQLVPNFAVSHLVGASCCLGSSTNNGLSFYLSLIGYLYDNAVGKITQLISYKLNLDTNEWQGKPIEVEFPEDISSIQKVKHVRGFNFNIFLLLYGYSDTFAGSQWYKLEITGDGKYIRHIACMATEDFIAAECCPNNIFHYVAALKFGDDRYLRLIDIRTEEILDSHDIGRKRKILGMYVTGNEVYVFRSGSEGGEWVVEYNAYEKKGNVLIPKHSTWMKAEGFISGSKIDEILPVSSLDPSSLHDYVYYSYEPISATGAFKFIRGVLERDGASHIKELSEMRTKLTPVFEGPIELTNQDLSDDSLQERHDRIEKEILMNIGPNTRDHTYITELYYFVPLLFALQLIKSREFQEALDWIRTIYNYAGDFTHRKIYPPLEWEYEQSTDGLFERPDDWLRDPLNPHGIGETRAGAYSRFTLFTLVRCLLDYADSEYMRDTAESLPRARELYENALALLDVPDFHLQTTAPDAVLRRLISVKTDPFGTIGESMVNRRAARERVQLEMARQPSVQQLIKSASTRVGQLYQSALAKVSAGVTLEVKSVGLKKVEPLDIETAETMEIPLDITLPVEADPKREVTLAEAKPAIMRDFALQKSSDAIASMGVIGKVPIGQYDYCIPENPLLSTLRLRGEINLHKLRNCRNIAGMERQVEPYSTAVDIEDTNPVLAAVFRAAGSMLGGDITIRPTQYRYQGLISRAKELVNIAQQMEAAMLSALEKRDLAAYNELKARQDVQIARAGVRLQDLRIASAGHGVTLAELQKKRAQLQVDSLQGMIDEGLLSYENKVIGHYESAREWQIISTAYDAVLQSAQVSGGNVLAAAGALIAYGISASLKANVIGEQTAAQVYSIYASYERRAQEWEYQKSIAQKDVAIGAQQITLAQDQVRITRQERNIAGMQADHAETIANFLANKFTNADLYDWMSGILEGVFSYFLQQATAVAKLAENQLAFERQEIPAGIIQPDYWEPPNEGQIGADNEEQDRRGLTGSARLLRDIYQLDQYRFDTEKRKLQLTKTISLSQLAPAELQRFRETGVITFATPMELFDRDFPGHYLRLIKRVRTSVLALIPPTAGIHATLTTTGVSRVVVGGYTFEEITVRRDPESVALTSPQNATGLFELTPDTDMLLPFEGNGVDTLWEFRMPKAANQFNYQTIADVLVTIEYTALDSDIYRQQVLAQMDRRVLSDRGFSFQQQFPDQWYHLNNPEDDTKPVCVSFTTDRNAFPPNIDQLKIEHLLLYFSLNDADDVDVEHLYFFDQQGSPPLGGAARTVDGRISTRWGNAGSWLAITGRQPLGRWELELPVDTVKRIKEGKITDILFVISYSGQTPAWPQ